MSCTLTSEITTVIPAPRLFKAAILDWHNLAPKIAADRIVSAVNIGGDGGVGTVRQINFGPAMPFSYEQRRLEFQDVENCEIKSSVVGGGGLGVFFESSSYHVKFSPNGTGGSLAKIVLTYTPMPGANSAQYEKMVKGALEGIIKGSEAFLLANPDAYN
ncbi:pathogenesis-related protein 1-like [Carex rostrata]